MKSTTFLSVRQVIGHWLIWLLVIVISLCFADTPAVLALERASCHPGGSTPTPGELLAPVMRLGDIPGHLFPWRLRPSRHRRSFRWLEWVVRVLRLWAQLRRMKGWTMAQWVCLFTRCQVCHLLGALLILYPLLEELEVAEIVNQYCPTEAEVEHGTVVVVLALNRLAAPRPLYKVADWMAYSILPQVLGMPAQKFNDNRLGTAHQQEILQRIGLAGKTLLDVEGWQTNEVLGTRLTFPPPREYSLLDGGRAA